MFTAPTTTSFPPFNLPNKSEYPPPPIMNLAAELEESSANNTSVADNSSLTIEEVEMEDCD